MEAIWKSMRNFFENGPAWAGWVLLVALLFGSYHLLIAVSRNPPLLLTIFWGVVYGLIAIFTIAVYRASQEGKKKPGES